ncbi:unnamed protein product [Symbiodinium sp. CCMP2592]|nr:unnamed protein product [Symbiodinium sp. CCMP2592]
MLSAASLMCSALHRNRCRRLIRNSSQIHFHIRGYCRLQANGCRSKRHSHLHRRLQAGCRSGRRGGPIILPIIFLEAPAASGDQEGALLETPGLATVPGIDGIDVRELSGCRRLIRNSSQPHFHIRGYCRLQANGCRSRRHSHLHRRLQAGCRSGRGRGPIIFPIIFLEAPAASGDQEGALLETPGLATVPGIGDIRELSGLLKGLLVQSMPWAVVACTEAVEAEMVVPGDEPPRHDLHLLHSFGAEILEEDAAQVAAVCGGLQVDHTRLSLHNPLAAPLVLVLRHVRGLARTCDALHQNASAQGLIQMLPDPLVLQIVATGALQNAYFRPLRRCRGAKSMRSWPRLG